MGVNLSSGAISKIVTGKCTEKDLLKPVLQVISIRSDVINTSGKQWYMVALSDGSFWQFACIADDIFILNKLQKGSIVQLTKFQVAKLIVSNIKDEIISKSAIYVWDYNLLRSQRDIIGNPKQKQDHVDSLLNEDIDDSRHVEEPPTSKQKPSTSTQKCSSHSPTQNKKRKLQPIDDAISVSGKDISDVMKMMVEITNDVRVLYKKVETLDEDVSKMMRMMMEKNKEDDMGACIEKLDKMGWGAEEPIYDTALLLFLKGADYRKLWLHLKPECCGKWVKIAGSIFGLLD